MPAHPAMPGLTAATHRPHALHAPERTWVEKNCYVDVWIELLGALGLDPLAMLGTTVALDFEGDQWTFYKPSHDEVRALYGIDVRELNVWRPIDVHLAEHVGAGHLVSTEADAFYLPDVAGTDYRRQHAKTTIVVAAVDLAARRLGYFHNAGYFELEGEDFDGALGVGGAGTRRTLPLYAELLRLDRRMRRSGAALRAQALELLAGHLRRVPDRDPVEAFAARIEADLAALVAEGPEAYHAWAFATLRQLGSAAELSALHFAWLADGSTGPLADAAAAFERVSVESKSMVLKAARVVVVRKPWDPRPALESIGRARNEGLRAAAAALRGDTVPDALHRA
jgi:hypothetical protein